MRKQDIWKRIESEMKRSKQELPNWPDHAAAQGGVVCRHSGELMKDCLEFKYKKASDDLQKSKMIDSAIRTAVASIRFLENI